MVPQKYIICVDDEKIILDSLTTQLARNLGVKYLYEFAESAEEALELIHDIFNQGDYVVLIISDQVMPGMTGDQFLVNVHESYPKPIKVLLTGQATIDSAINSINNANLFSYLRKPWNENELITTIERGLEHYNMQEKIERQVQVFQRFVPKDFLRLLQVDNFEEITTDTLSSKEELIIVSADIRGFTGIAEKLGSEQTFNLLNSYFDKMSSVVINNGGIIEKFIGDAFLAIFKNDNDKVFSACLEFYSTLEEFNKTAIHPISIGTAVGKGKITLGTIGGKERIDVTVIGDPVNRTCRVEALTKFYNCKILLCEEVLDRATNDSYQTRYVDTVKLRGMSEPLRIYELLDTKNEPEKTNLILSYKNNYLEAMELYKHRKFDDARKLIMECLKHNPQDPILSLYLTRIEVLSNSHLTPQWAAITDFNIV